MPEPDDFMELMNRVRQGDAAAASEVVRQYEPEVRRVIRLRLTDQRMRRILDSSDVCQSVMANFFVRVAAGQYDIQDPKHLVQLLCQMARNKILDHARRQRASRRDQRRLATVDTPLAIVEDPADTPSQQIATDELIHEVRRRLTSEERYLSEQRQAGKDWQDLASELGKSPEALRKQLARGVARVSLELGLASGNESAAE